MKSLETRRLQLTLKLPSTAHDDRSKTGALNVSDHMTVNAITLRQSSDDVTARYNRSKVVTSHHSNDSLAPSLSRTNNARSMVEVSTLRSGGDRAFTSQSVRRLSHRILKGNAVRTQNRHTRAVSSKTYTDYTRAGHSDLKCNTAPLPVRAYHIQLPGVIIKNARRGSLRPVGTTTALLPLRTESPHVQACRARPNTMGPLPQLCNVSDVRSTPAIHRKILHSTLT